MLHSNKLPKHPADRHPLIYNPTPVLTHPRSGSAPLMRSKERISPVKIDSNTDMNEHKYLEKHSFSDIDLLNEYHKQNSELHECGIRRISSASQSQYFSEEFSSRGFSSATERISDSDKSPSDKCLSEKSDYAEIFKIHDDNIKDHLSLSSTQGSFYNPSGINRESTNNTPGLYSPLLAPQVFHHYMDDQRSNTFSRKPKTMVGDDSKSKLKQNPAHHISMKQQFPTFSTSQCYHTNSVDYSPDMRIHHDYLSLCDVDSARSSFCPPGMYAVNPLDGQYPYHQPKRIYGINTMDSISAIPYLHEKTSQSFLTSANYNSPLYSPPPGIGFDSFSPVISQYDLPYHTQLERNVYSSAAPYFEDMKNLGVSKHSTRFDSYSTSRLKSATGGYNAPAYDIEQIKGRTLSAAELKNYERETLPLRSLSFTRQPKSKFSNVERPISNNENITSKSLPYSITLDSVKGNIFAISSDQSGCRQLQQLLVDQKDAASLIFDEVKDHLSELMTHPFGNYLFQKLLENLSIEERTEAITRVSPKLVQSGKSLHGTRSVQKVVQMAETKKEREQVIAGLYPGVVQLATDSNGNHIIQRVLQHFAIEGDSAFVYETLNLSLKEIATHRYGCCVVQRALDAASYEQRLTLVSLVAKDAFELMQDPFGNYVVQYVLDKCAANEVESITKVPLGNVCALSSHKFSSNVVEKCLDKASPTVKSLYIREIISIPNIGSLIQDQYANYVLQRALSVASPVDFALLTEVVRPYLSTMSNSTGGRKIALKIKKRFSEIQSSHNTPVSYMGDSLNTSNLVGAVTSVDDELRMLDCQLQQLQV